ncbi:MAG: hypothetical protein ACRD9R_19295 [Pyrinomonadaceae bacterium]
MVSLRERGIYCAPDGTRLVASNVRHGASARADFALPAGRGNNNNGGQPYYLFNSYAWSFHEAPDYEVRDCGCVVSLHADARPGWDATDLADTEWTAGAH